MGPEALEGIKEGLGVGSVQGALIVIGVCTFLLLLLMLQILVRKAKEKRRLRQSWQGFARRLGRLNTGMSARNLLNELARREAPSNPQSLLDDREVFEKAVHRHLKPLVLYGREEESREQSALVAEARAALGFAEHSPRIFYSTRDLEAGRVLEVQVPEEDGEQACAAQVATQREDVLLLSGVQHPSLRPGRRISVQFGGDGRFFRFDSEVLDVDRERGYCTLAHTLDVRAADAREFYRAEVDGPLTFRADWEGEDVVRQGTLLNISAGGAALRGGCFYEEGELLVLRLEPDRYLGQDAGDDLPDREIVGAVLEAQRTAGNECIYRVEFRHADNDTRRYILRLVQRLELHAKRAAR